MIQNTKHVFMWLWACGAKTCDNITNHKKRKWKNKNMNVNCKHYGIKSCFMICIKCYDLKYFIKMCCEWPLWFSIAFKIRYWGTFWKIHDMKIGNSFETVANHSTFPSWYTILRQQKIKNNYRIYIHKKMDVWGWEWCESKKSDAQQKMSDKTRIGFVFYAQLY